MPSKDPVQRFEDILVNIERIEAYTQDLDCASFLADHKTYDAVERCLGISEAAKKLGPEAEELCPGIPWPQLRSLGNFLRHEYARIEGERLWFMVERDLEPLRVAAAGALRRLSSET